MLQFFKQKRGKNFALVAVSVGIVSGAALAAQPWWHVIGWHPKANKSKCDGYYTPIPKMTRYTIPLPGSKHSSITSSGVADLANNGDSILRGNVVLRQPGRVILADKAIITRSARLAKIVKIRLYGHVFIFTTSRMATAPYAVLYPRTNVLQTHKATYRFSYPGTNLTSWGHGKKLHGQNHQYWNMRNATYSVCSPNHPSWLLHARRVHFDQQKKRVTAHHVWLKMHKIPVLYTPYMSFSLDNQRKSGFLPPSYVHSTTGGSGAALPFYWNIAPNYDALFTTSYYSKRHFKEDVLFRHLNTWGKGTDSFLILPNDNSFSRFKHSVATNGAITNAAPYLSQLRSESSTRWSMNLDEKAKYGKKWSGILQFNHLSDPYLMQDFAYTNNFVEANQLFNQAVIAYQDNWLQADVLAQGFQTLHPINQSPTTDQYQRLPEVDVGMQHSYGKLNLGLDSQWVDFAYDDFTGSNTAFVGSRLHFRPRVSFSEVKSWGYVTPEVQTDVATYAAHTINYNTRANTSRGIPMFDVDSGLYLEQNFHWRKHKYTQYVTPRLFYLYVPYHDQNYLPNFASTELPFTYDQLFADNRYTDFDRIQNANQLSFGIQTSTQDETGFTKWTLGTGVADYFSQPRVTLQPSDTITKQRFSPWTTTLTYYFNPRLSSSLTYNQNLDHGGTDSASANVTYLDGQDRVMNVGYDFIRNYGATNYNNFTLGYLWPITSRWSALGYWSYDMQADHTRQYYLGAEYGNCCWAVRLLYNNLYIGSGIASSRKYNHQYLFQIVFKGLTSFGPKDAVDSVITNTLPGQHNSLGEIR